MHYFSTLFGKELRMFWTDLLSIISSLNNVFTAIGICHSGCDLKIKIYRTIILPVVLYGCEAWSLTLREERRLRVFENRLNLRGTR
jgi:hypothetical protein